MKELKVINALLTRSTTHPGSGNTMRSPSHMESTNRGSLVEGVPAGTRVGRRALEIHMQGPSCIVVKCHGCGTLTRATHELLAAE